MVYTPLCEELMCGGCREFGATVCGALVRDAEGCESAARAVKKALGSRLCPFNDGPVRVAVHNDKVVGSFVVKEVSADALEGVCWGGERVRQSTGLGRRHAVAVVAGLP